MSCRPSSATLFTSITRTASQVRLRIAFIVAPETELAAQQAAAAALSAARAGTGGTRRGNGGGAAIAPNPSGRWTPAAGQAAVARAMAYLHWPYSFAAGNTCSIASSLAPGAMRPTLVHGSCSDAT
jgi:hypothetical protein